MNETILALLRDHGRLAVSTDSIAPGDDLFALGLSSMASVNLMLAIEEAFDVEIPDSMLNRNSFRSVDSIVRMLESLKATGAAA